MILLATPLRKLFLDDRNQDHVVAGIDRWQEDLNAALQGHLAEPLAWDEAVSDPPASVQLSDASYRAVCLLACYAQHTELEWPDRLSPVVDTDPAWQRASESDFARFRMPQIVIPRCWLPGDFACTLKFSLPDGEATVLGSLDGLCLQLRNLNRNTLNLPGDGSSAPGGDAPAGDADFLTHAGHGLAVMLFMAAQASRLHIPLLLRG